MKLHELFDRNLIINASDTYAECFFASAFGAWWEDFSWDKTGAYPKYRRQMGYRVTNPNATYREPAHPTAQHRVAASYLFLAKETAYVVLENVWEMAA